jgi:hypothetical protein
METPRTARRRSISGGYVAVATLIAFVVAMVLGAALWVFLHATDPGKSALAVLAGRDPPYRHRSR